MIASNDQLYELPIAGLAFQEEIMDDAEHRFSYRYKRNVRIKVRISQTDNGISLSLISNKENKKVKKLLTTIETHLVEKIREHPRYRMYLVTGNKSIDTDIDYDVKEYLSIVYYHYEVWGQWLSILLMIGACFWDIKIGEWVGWLFFGCLVVHFILSMVRLIVENSGDPKTHHDAIVRIMVSGVCMMVYTVIFILVLGLAEAAQRG